MITFIRYARSRKIWKPNNLVIFGNNKTAWSKQESQNRLGSPVSGASIYLLGSKNNKRALERQAKSANVTHVPMHSSAHWQLLWVAYSVQGECHSPYKIHSFPSLSKGSTCFFQKLDHICPSHRFPVVMLYAQLCQLYEVGRVLLFSRPIKRPNFFFLWGGGGLFLYIFILIFFNRYFLLIFC